jgi:hypothetical protein
MDAIGVVVEQVSRVYSTRTKGETYTRLSGRLFPIVSNKQSADVAAICATLTAETNWPVRRAVGLYGALRDRFASAFSDSPDDTLVQAWRGRWRSYGATQGLSERQHYWADVIAALENPALELDARTVGFWLACGIEYAEDLANEQRDDEVATIAERCTRYTSDCLDTDAALALQIGFWSNTLSLNGERERWFKSASQLSELHRLVQTHDLVRHTDITRKFFASAIKLIDAPKTYPDEETLAHITHIYSVSIDTLTPAAQYDFCDVSIDGLAQLHSSFSLANGDGRYPDRLHSAYDAIRRIALQDWLHHDWFILISLMTCLRNVMFLYMKEKDKPNFFQSLAIAEKIFAENKNITGLGAVLIAEQYSRILRFACRMSTEEIGRYRENMAKLNGLMHAWPGNRMISEEHNIAAKLMTSGGKAAP